MVRHLLSYGYIGSGIPKMDVEIFDDLPSLFHIVWGILCYFFHFIFFIFFFYEFVEFIYKYKHKEREKLKCFIGDLIEFLLPISIISLAFGF
jgi:hypothetical protein